MKLTNIIIADLNKRNAYSDFYTGDHKYIDNSNEVLCDKIKGLFINLRVAVAYSFEEIDDIIKNEVKERVIIFSNFPANNSYKRYKTQSKDGSRGYLADGYNITAQKYKLLLNSNEYMDLHIVTGASDTLLSDKDVVSLSNKHNISIKRKADWIHKSTEFMDNFEAYIIDVVKNE